MYSRRPCGGGRFVRRRPFLLLPLMMILLLYLVDCCDRIIRCRTNASRPFLPSSAARFSIVGIFCIAAVVIAIAGRVMTNSSIRPSALFDPSKRRNEPGSFIEGDDHVIVLLLPLLIDGLRQDGPLRHETPRGRYRRESTASTTSTGSAHFETLMRGGSCSFSSSSSS